MKFMINIYEQIHIFYVDILYVIYRGVTKNRRMKNRGKYCVIRNVNTKQVHYIIYFTWHVTISCIYGYRNTINIWKRRKYLC